ncbi:MAG: VanW family protein [Patescibacteria group bacterium]
MIFFSSTIRMFFLKRRHLVAAVFGITVVGLGSLPFIDARLSRNSIVRGIRVADISLGGLTQAQAEQILAEHAKKTESLIPLHLGEFEVALSDIATLNTQATIARAMTVGRESNLLSDFLERTRVRLAGKDVAPVWNIDETSIGKKIEDAFSGKLQTPRNASFSASFDDQGRANVTILPEQRGERIDKESALRDLQKRLVEFSTAPVSLATIAVDPEITADELTPLREYTERILSAPGITLTLEKQSWPIKKEDFAAWLRVRATDGGPVVNLDHISIEAFLTGIAKTVDHPAQEPVLELDESGLRVKKFIPPQDGLTIVAGENTEKITAMALNLDGGAKRTLELVVATAHPKTALESTNTLGIKEHLSIATTNFKGSPPNRVKNIKRGAAMLHGSLLPPGEEFSLLDHLRPFTLENGYFPELVIKAAEGRTTPEIGGGLCQIGTTSFRTVMNAGLPITVRQNHSYRVSYYEPPVGMDATIYDPAPDFKFINNTGGHLLLTTKVAGTNLTFEFWGTPDGRHVEISTPVVTNITSPPPKKIIETLDLKPGQTKCTEKPHPGADAVFTYKIFSTDGTVAEKEFKSRYRPWQEVCLVGVEKLSEPVPPPTNATAPEVLPHEEILGAQTPVLQSITAPQAVR